MRNLLGFTALAFASLASCGKLTSIETQNSTNPNGSQLLGNPSSSQQQLVHKIVAAADSVSWAGTRHYEAHFDASGAPANLVYDEQVITDGHGRFHVAPSQLIAPQLSSSEASLFFLSQSQREGFMFRHRDNTVRSEQLFFLNYAITDHGQIAAIAGRSCAVWSIASQSGQGDTWNVWVDLATGVILKSQELDAGGALVVGFEYLDFTLDPDTSNAVWYVDPLGETQLDLGQSTEQLGFAPKTPKLLPYGYRLASSTEIVDPTDGHKWARFIYSDGWSEFIFLDGGPGGSLGTVQGKSPQADVMRTLAIGPWNIADGRIAARRVVAMARTPLAQLQGLIEATVY